MGFLALMGGLTAYSILALRLPDMQILLDWSVIGSAVVFALGGALIGVLATISWHLVYEASRQRSLRKASEIQNSAHQGEDQAQEEQPPSNPD